MSQANQTVPHDGLGRLERAARSTGRRLRLRRALTAGAAWLPLPLGYAALVLGAVKALPLSALQARPWLWGALVPAACVVVAAARAAWSRRAPFEGALVLDRHHGLEDRVANALAFSRLPAAEQTPLMQAAIADAAQHADKLQPARAARIAVPRELGLSALLVLGLFGLSVLEVRQLREVPPPVVK